jgi:hypothetical protein
LLSPSGAGNSAARAKTFQLEHFQQVACLQRRPVDLFSVTGKQATFSNAKPAQSENPDQFAEGPERPEGFERNRLFSTATNV